jgi:hypothetical protein
VVGVMVVVLVRETIPMEAVVVRPAIALITTM